MFEATLKRLLLAGESDTVEFKVATPRYDVLGKVVCAFLNQRGGAILLGVGDAGDILGCTASGTYIAQLKSVLAEKISPAATLAISSQEVEGKRIVIVEVPEGGAKPYVFSGTIYVRTGSNTRKADASQIGAMISPTPGWIETTRWERLPALGIRLSDLDLATLAVIRERLEVRMGFQSTDNMAFLERMGLASNGTLHNSAVILFGSNPALRYPQIAATAKRYTGRARKRLVDRLDLERNALATVDDLIAFVAEAAQKLQRRDRIREGASIPMMSVREGILNAVMHRDYSAYNGGVRVSVFETQIEIWNSGTLPPGLTIEDLSRPHPSIPVNPDTAQLFFAQGLVETIGSGTLRMIDECGKLGLPAPRWSTESGGLQVTVPFLKAVEPRSVAVHEDARGLNKAMDSDEK